MIKDLSASLVAAAAAINTANTFCVIVLIMSKDGLGK